MTLDPQHLRMAEAILFAATAPLKDSEIAERLPDGADVPAILAALADHYAGRGVELVKRGPVWLFQTAPDLAFLMRKEVDELKKLSRAAVETLAIVAYHQPVSRADIEDIRGVSLSKGTLDLLLEAGWVKPVGRREAPGRPVIYGTTVEFLAHFGLESIKDLPGLEELKGAGLLEPQEVSLGEAMGVERTLPDDLDLGEPLDDATADPAWHDEEGAGDDSPADEGLEQAAPEGQMRDDAAAPPAATDDNGHDGR